MDTLLSQSIRAAHLLRGPLGSEAIRVLHVEAKPGDATRDLESLSRASGFELTHAQDMEEALRLLYEEAFDVILLDLGSREVDAADVVHQVGRNRSSTPLVALSGSRDENLALAVIGSGAQDFLVGGEIDDAGVARALRYAVRRRRSQSKLAYLAQHDHLTGLATLALFRDRLEHTIARAGRQHNALALMFIDLDGLKAVNETLGHDAGDALLREVARRLASSCRQSDTVARLGGDEFAIILEGIGHSQAATKVAQQMLDTVGRPIPVGRGEVVGRLSIGIALFPQCGRDPASLIRSADRAVDLAKSEGGGCYRFYTDDMDEKALARLRLEADLQRAIDAREFTLFYQPQVDLLDFELRGMEALIRWKPWSGEALLAPAEFIPVAEETGLIVPIGEWVLNAACAQARSWHVAGLPDCRMSVNISARQFEDQDFVAVVDRALADTGLDPRLLDLELTETALIRDRQQSVEMLGALKRRGVGISVDDFGTGYCSLSYLREFPIDTLKMDRSFISDVHNAVDSAIATAIIDLAHSLELRVVAEGVETEQQLLHVRSLGPDEVQGILIGPPREAVGFPPRRIEPRGDKTAAA